MGKFKVGDKIKHVFGHGDGFIERIEVVPGHPPTGWLPTKANNYTPPKTPDQNIYYIRWVNLTLSGANVPLFEYTIEIDKKYYIRENRDSQIESILNK